MPLLFSINYLHYVIPGRMCPVICFSSWHLRYRNLHDTGKKNPYPAVNFKAVWISSWFTITIYHYHYHLPLPLPFTITIYHYHLPLPLPFTITIYHYHYHLPLPFTITITIYHYHYHLPLPLPLPLPFTITIYHYHYHLPLPLPLLFIVIIIIQSFQKDLAPAKGFRWLFWYSLPWLSVKCLLEWS